MSFTISLEHCVPFGIERRDRTRAARVSETEDARVNLFEKLCFEQIFNKLISMLFSHI